MSRLFLLPLTAAIVFSSGGAQAELGGNVTSVHSDQIRMKATLQARVANVATPYSVHTLSTEIGVIIHEYADAAGTVFAVTWSGPTKPNLRQLLGRYFEPFISASASTKKTGHRPDNHQSNRSGGVFWRASPRVFRQCPCPGTGARGS